MGSIRWALGCAAALLLLYLYLVFLHPGQRIADHAFFVGPNPIAIAHRGGMGLWPENTLFALERSRALGVDVLEVDLRNTADGHIVLIHDEAVDRTTDGSGLVRDMTLSELRGLDAGYRFRAEDGSFPYRGAGLRIPALEEVLRTFADTRLNMEMKQLPSELVLSLCGLIRRHAMENRVLIASFSHESMAAFREACPRVATSATSREALAFHQLNRFRLGSLYRSPAVAFQVPEYYGESRVVVPELLELASSHDLRVLVWTVNEAPRIERLLAMGVNGILTDYPDRLMHALDRSRTGLAGIEAVQGQVRVLATRRVRSRAP